jgi:glycosyltransferase involved in cell wall biosynthesis
VTPRVTVLIGAYNNAATLPQAIGSILGQSVSQLELLVLDDGSSDETAAVVAGIEDERLRYVPLEHMGIARSLNLGIDQARAPVVAVQDADDWSEPQRLERQLAVLGSSPEVAVVGGLMREVDEQGRELVPRTGHGVGDVNDLLMRYNPLPNSCAAYRRDVVLELGGYDARYRYAAEYDLWLRIAERHRVVVVDEVLATRRMSGTNVAGRRERAPIAEAIAIRLRAIRRRRSLAGAQWLAVPLLSFLTPTPLKRARRRRLGQAP